MSQCVSRMTRGWFRKHIDRTKAGMRLTSIIFGVFAGLIADCLLIQMYPIPGIIVSTVVAFLLLSHFLGDKTL